MKIKDVPFSITDWEKIEPIEHKGESGTSYWRNFESGNIRVRMVEFLPGFRADHWCPRGHILLVLAGDFFIKFKDGKIFQSGSGTSIQVSDDESNPHLIYTENGAIVFIVD